MISSVFITGETSKVLDHNTRLIMVSRPVMDINTRSYLVDTFVVKVTDPVGSCLQIMKVPEGTLVMVKGRIQSDLAANEVLKANGIEGTCFVIVAELTECFTLTANMKGYQEFFPTVK